MVKMESAMRIDHIAYPCHNPFDTHRFYSEVMGLELLQAYSGKDLLLVYAIPGGGSLVFSASSDGTPLDEKQVSWDRQHVGLTVSTRGELEQWIEKLKALNVVYQLIDNERVYFSDPNGLVLELEVAEPATRNPRAAEILARWANAESSCFEGTDGS
jgi:catechol 2,3-dioxygenase-like lactoylglutathione lyase family enzyme